MEWLNYHHLLYFWVVAREGGISRAGRRLNLAPSTISAQVQLLERHFDEPLFHRAGRRLELTDAGRVVLRYADEIFSIGQELQDVLKGDPAERPMQIDVGIADALPKLVSLDLLKPLLELGPQVKLRCREDDVETLLGELALHRLHVVLSDTPPGTDLPVKVYCHQLGETALAFMGSRDLVNQRKDGYPDSLNGAPLLLPARGSAVRRSVDEWLNERSITPRIVGEFDDSALMKEFASIGAGLFPGPMVVHESICAQYNVEVLSPIEGVAARFYAVSAERRIRHPAVVKLVEGARDKLS